MKWEFRKMDDYGELIFSGEITVQCISELLPVLSRSLDKVQRLALRLEGVECVDISFLQLLCSAHKTSCRLMKELTLATSAPSFERAVEESGYLCHFRCPQGIAESCFLNGNERTEAETSA